MNAKTAALILGVFFLAIGILGFVPNRVISPEGFFAVNPPRNILHLITGVVLLASFVRSRAKLRLKTVGAVYAIIATLGFFAAGADRMILGFIHVAEPDRWFHVIAAAVLLAAGFGLPDERKG